MYYEPCSFEPYFYGKKPIYCFLQDRMFIENPNCEDCMYYEPPKIIATLINFALFKIDFKKCPRGKFLTKGKCNKAIDDDCLYCVLNPIYRKK